MTGGVHAAQASSFRHGILRFGFALLRLTSVCLMFHCFARGACQFFSNLIENAVNKTAGFSAAEFLCELDCFVN
jgi:hypothetical protein